MQNIKNWYNVAQCRHFDTIREYYHGRLYRNTEALEYLEKRGLKHGELFERFEVGFADGSLLGRVSKAQKEQLKELGILRENGHEHMRGCITVPLYDTKGHTVGLYGRSIKENRRTPHLYLRGGRRGIFNRKASKVYDEIIPTESIIDAMSLVAMGLENVQALYGVNGFTEEHLKVLKQDRVKRVVLGFDNDEAGKKGAEEQTEKFLAEGFEVKQVFPTLKDWNEELCSKAETHENGSIKDTRGGLLSRVEGTEEAMQGGAYTIFSKKQPGFISISKAGGGCM